MYILKSGSILLVLWGPKDQWNLYCIHTFCGCKWMTWVLWKLSFRKMARSLFRIFYQLRIICCLLWTDLSYALYIPLSPAAVYSSLAGKANFDDDNIFRKKSSHRWNLHRYIYINSTRPLLARCQTFKLSLALWNMVQCRMGALMLSILDAGKYWTVI